MMSTSVFALDNLRFSQIASAQGLSQNTVSATIQDHRGYLWVGTQDGLNRYDGLHFELFKNQNNNLESISDNVITTMFEDSAKRLWIGTRNGLNRYQQQTGQFIRYPSITKQHTGLSHHQIESLFEDSQGTLWAGSFSGLSRYNSKTDTFTSFPFTIDNKPLTEKQPEIRAIGEDNTGRLWLATDQGLLHLVNDRQGSASSFFATSRRPDLAGSEINFLLFGRDGTLWIASAKQGLIHVDINSNKIEQFVDKNSEIDPADGIQKSLLSNDINYLLEDPRGQLWLGSVRGLSVKELDSKGFSHFTYDQYNPDSISHNNVQSIYQDRSGVLWIGTLLGGLSKHVVAQEVFSHYKAGTNTPTSLSSNSIRAFSMSPNGTLWIGTDKGLNKLNAHRNKVDIIGLDQKESSALTGKRHWALWSDNDETLWVGTKNNGLHKFNTVTGQITKFQHEPDNKNSISSNKVRTIFRDSQQRLWIGTWGGGLSRFDDSTGQFTNYLHNDDEPVSISDNRVTSIVEDSKGTLWVATQNGVNSFSIDDNSFTQFSDDRLQALTIEKQDILWIGSRKGLFRRNIATGEVRHFGKAQGLLNETIYAIQIADNGDIWVSTNQGLFKLDSKSLKFTRYTQADGLQANEFNTRAAFKGNNGELLFGGIKGFNSFKTQDVKTDPVAPQLVLTDFRLFNKSVTLSTDELKTPLSRQLDFSKEITLDHTQSMLSFEFAALHFVDPAINQYQYRLDGFDNNWISTDASRPFAAYTNLDAGEYTFMLRGANKDNVWAEREFPLTLTVLPPPWKTWWAYLIYSLLLISIIASYLRFQQRKLAKEREINQQLRAVDKMKDELLANTSHELRTPLNGIIGLADSMNDSVDDSMPGMFSENLDMIVTSGRRLSNLVDQILDFSKLRSGNKQADKVPVNLFLLVNAVLKLSRHDVKAKQLALINDVPTDLPEVIADKDMLTQILHNFVGNSVKFTEQGEIRISAQLNKDKVSIKVIDTGIGIPQDKQAVIFEAFKQADGSTERNYGGTGLGLAVTTELVGLHGSAIALESEPGKGSSFGFYLESTGKVPALPADIDISFLSSTSHAQVETSKLSKIVSLPVQQASNMSKTENSEQIKTDKVNNNITVLDSQKCFRVLIVDDEPINRHVLKNYLASYNFELIEASGGEQALEIAESKERIDLVLLDVMMPKMSGYEVCKTLRKRFAVNDLPILFLTAKNQKEDIVNGFSVGGNDYLTKPIAKYELQSRVQTHLQLLDISRDMEEKVRDRTAEIEKMHAVLQLAYSDLEDESETDPLTGLRNRRYLTERIEGDIIAVNSRYAKMDSLQHVGAEHNLDMAFFMIDLDHFKRVNDDYGHSAGDKVLVKVAELLKDIFRESDHVVRWGGEEFLVVCQPTERCSAAAQAEKIRARIAATEFDIGNEQILKKTCSIGFAVYPFCRHEPEAVGWEQVLELADSALYAAKLSRRDAWVGVDCQVDCLPESFLETWKTDPTIAINNNEVSTQMSINDTESLIWK